MPFAPNVQLLGESCLVLTVGDRIDRQLCRRLIRSAERIRSRQPAGVRDVLHTYTTLAVHFDPDQSNQAELGDAMRDAFDSVSDIEGEAVRHDLRTIYNGPDLARVAEHASMSEREVVARHAGEDYLVAMIGFQPHFPYLLGLDRSLRVPRLESPRPRVPAGSVAIAAEQAGVYPAECPGGWNLLGRCDPANLDTIEPGDTVRFIPVDTL